MPSADGSRPDRILVEPKASHPNANAARIGNPRGILWTETGTLEIRLLVGAVCTLLLLFARLRFLLIGVGLTERRSGDAR